MDSRGLRDLLPTTFDGVLYQVGSWFCEVDDIAGTFGELPDCSGVVCFVILLSHSCPRLLIRPFHPCSKDSKVLAQDSVDRPFAYLRRHGTSFLRHCHHDCSNDCHKTATIAIMTSSCRLPMRRQRLPLLRLHADCHRAFWLLECHWNFA